MEMIRIRNLAVNRFILGGNPFSAISHQGEQTDRRMARYFSAARIKTVLREAESLGVNTIVARVDNHIIRLLLEYWDEGGAIQWFAQTCPEYASLEASLEKAIGNGAKGCHIHGGVMDYLLAQKKLDAIPAALETIRKAGLAAGVAGHNPEVFRWAKDKLDVDYYMCSYYNAAHRDERAEHVSGMPEWFMAEDRVAMTDLIQTLSRPVIHYKILAAGRNDPAEAFSFAAQHMRPNDAVCVGIYPEGHPGMLKDDLRLLTEALTTCRGNR